jgi:RNA-binding protein YhbY
MDALFTSLASELVKMKLYQQQSDDHESAIEKVSAQLDFMTDQIRNYKYTLPTTNPVKQKNMKKGKIELF